MAALPETLPQPDPLSPYLAEAENYIHAKAANTVKAYQSDWVSFETFCRSREVASLPAAPAVVAAYAAEAAHRSKPTP